MSERRKVGWSVNLFVLCWMVNPEKKTQKKVSPFWFGFLFVGSQFCDISIKNHKSLSLARRCYLLQSDVLQGA